MLIDCVADLHGFFPELEGGDLLIIAGDLTGRDALYEYGKFFEWLARQSYKKKILIAGNHDNVLEKRAAQEVAHELCGMGADNFEYLCDSACEFEGLKIWGSPWTKTFPGMNPHCKAFTVDTEEELFNKFEKIPHDTDILITHSPPLNVLDKTIAGLHVGSSALYTWLKYVERPKLHVFGHIHEAYGRVEVFPTYEDKMMVSVNASIVNERYQPVNKPVRVIL